ncbi:hypothetical protein CAPTEDRAFT_180996 [Capitella teleta]|uniref:Peptidase M14 domain-containing protein n=1 Tax=Capitella teleta TaxID=283909 RepID=R7T627_CAPTE|nr:hypothetical protein CAPTEDRAFT_180996 [Capitella teleta]|eukprot:ELT88949.1 hypothetical protein CAPTEDRAFT_180996 [Capitella teleta]
MVLVNFRLIHDEGRGSRSKRAVNAQQEGIPSLNHTHYHTYDEISEWLDEVGRSCGSACSVFSIGNSTENRNLKVIRIGSEGANKPIVWIDAGIHAREWIAPATALYIISKVYSRSRLNRYLNTKYTWYILPLANPDGYDYTWTSDRLWRKTRSVHPTNSCRGVDPNRNWGFHWAGLGTSANPCSENYHGLQPFSEPETQAISQFVLSLGDRLLVYLSLHSYGQYWLAPWGYTYRVPDDYLDMLYVGNQAADALKRVQGTVYEVGASSRLLYLAAGGSDDWAKGVAGVKYAYTVELRDTGRHGFILPASEIQQTGREMLQAVRVLALIVLREQRLLERQQTTNSAPS